IEHSIQDAMRRLIEYGWWSSLKSIIIGSPNLIRNINGNPTKCFSVYVLKRLENRNWEDYGKEHCWIVPMEFLDYGCEGLLKLLEILKNIQSQTHS
ncbi:MAG: hypothetical protein ACP5HL_02705, partial [Minisyncoccia bacterium]